MQQPTWIPNASINRNIATLCPLPTILYWHRSLANGASISFIAPSLYPGSVIRIRSNNKNGILGNKEKGRVYDNSNSKALGVRLRFFGKEYCSPATPQLSARRSRNQRWRARRISHTRSTLLPGQPHACLTSYDTSCSTRGAPSPILVSPRSRKPTHEG